MALSPRIEFLSLPPQTEALLPDEWTTRPVKNIPGILVLHEDEQKLVRFRYKYNKNYTGKKLPKGPKKLKNMQDLEGTYKNMLKFTKENPPGFVCVAIREKPQRTSFSK